MDFERKIGKSDKRRTWQKKRQPLVTTRDNLLSGDTSFSEDRRFINWKKWLADRKKQTRRIESITGRSQADQLQSSSERFRAFVEMKNLMEHAAIPVPVIADKYRGGPEFWKTFEFLPERGDTCVPVLSLTPSRRDLNLPPDLMHVGLPDLIAKERDLVALKLKDESWKRSDYLKARTGNSTIGHSRTCLSEKEQPLLLFRIPLTTIMESEDELCEDANQAVVLKIQDREFVWRKSFFETESTDADPIMWSLSFTSKINERIEREIVLENKGTRVIVYHWRDLPFRSYGVFLEIRGSPFFFNKTKELILPGQIVRIKVWYRSRTSGVFTEFWRLVTDPILSSSTFVFRFWGCTKDSAELTDYRMIDEYLDCRIRDSTIHSIIEEIMDRIDYESELPHETSFSQSDVFISLNPHYYYHPSIVMQLQAIYSDVTDDDTSSWNLSLHTLRDIILEIKDSDYRRDMLARFNDLCNQSLKPNLTEPDVTYSSKYNAVYNILCTFANLFEDESEFVKRNNLIQEPIKMKQKQMPLSQKSNNSLQKERGEKLTKQSEDVQVHTEKENSDLNLRRYREIFFVRICKALEEAIEQVCASIDSFH
ncbi:MYCBP-associated protein-like [Pogonomyrmex barbatus]|uniref:MYCBP-associated protein-like n=1 Tax=Pogonomyrmex barbatus TaxID=144034 RepID=A0A6I9WL16_9HYME|nr:MYCBP-associated protein-like [Pogonomyrmex barbatus]